MSILRRHIEDFQADKRGISSVEFALLLAFIGAGIIFAANELGDAVSNEMTEAAGWFEGCENNGGGDGTGGDVGSGQGGDNTC